MNVNADVLSRNRVDNNIFVKTRAQERLENKNNVNL